MSPSAKPTMKQLEDMGVPAAALVKELRASVKAQTVTTGEGGKALSKPLKPSAAAVEAMASKLILPVHLVGAREWVVKQLVALV